MPAYFIEISFVQTRKARHLLETLFRLLSPYVTPPVRSGSIDPFSNAVNIVLAIKWKGWLIFSPVSDEHSLWPDQAKSQP